MLRDSEYADIGRFVTTIASAESVVAKLWWHRSFSAFGITLDPAKLHRLPLSDKITKLRALVARDGSRLDLQLAGLEDGFTRVSATRHTLVHGFTSEAGFDPSAINLRNDHRVWLRDLSQLLPWADYLCRLAIQAYSDATRGMYAAEEHMPPLAPILAKPAAPASGHTPDGRDDPRSVI